MVVSWKWQTSTKSREYNSWRSMRARCLNPKHSAYANYGGRGISICPEWLNDFDAFYHDMAPRPDGMTLDRIDNNGDYSKSNCRWVLVADQHNNKRTNVLLTKDGETLTVAQWTKRLGVTETVISARLRRGLPIERVLEPKLRQWKHGTRQAYEVHKCKCEECRAANTARHKQRRALKRA